MKHMTLTHFVIGIVALIAVFAILGFTKLPFKFKNHPLLYPISETHTPTNKTYDIAVIGAGAAGTMAIKRVILNNDTVLMFSGDFKNNKNSRGNFVRKIDNIPGFAQYERAVVNLRNETIVEIAEDKRFSHNFYFLKSSVKRIDKQENGFFAITDSKGNTYRARYVVLATGVMDEQPIIKGDISTIFPYANNQLIIYCIRCDGHMAVGKEVVVLGHTNSAAAAAILLHERYTPPKITILTHGKAPDFDETTINKLRKYHIDVITEQVADILGNADKKQLTGFLLAKGKKVNAQLGVVSMGIRPHNTLAKMVNVELDEQGCVKTDISGESSVENFFVIGDLQADAMNQVYTAWEQAVKAADKINARIRRLKFDK